MNLRFAEHIISGSRLLLTPRRFLRAKGFGVHSPFAYSFLSDVVRCPYAYYAYPLLDAIARNASPSISPKLMRLIFRVGARFDIRTAICLGPEAQAVNASLRLLRRQIRLVNPGAPAQILIAGRITPSQAKTLLQALPSVIILTGIRRKHSSTKRFWQQIDADTGHGMSFADTDNIIFINSPALPRQHFRICL